MSTTTPEPLGQYHGREADLTQELIGSWPRWKASRSTLAGSFDTQIR